MSFLNGQACHLISQKAAMAEIFFQRARDYYFFLRLLRSNKAKYQMRILGFCLLPNEFHLILCSPLADGEENFAKELWRIYATYRYTQASLAEDYRALPLRDEKISRDQDLFDAIKYIEFIPARLGLVDSPLRYPWSSCSYRVIGDASGLIDSALLVGFS